MRRAQTQATSGRPYQENLLATLAKLLPLVDPASHPFLAGNDSKNMAVVLLSTDKGLVGALNTNLMRTVSQMGKGQAIYYTVGRKGRKFVVKTGLRLKADFENVDTVTPRAAKQLAKLLIDSFATSEIGEADLIYPHFISTLKQEPKQVKLLPIDLQSIGDESSEEFLFDEAPDVLLDDLLVHHLEEQIYQALLETKAAEHSARMVTMKNATDNALDLVEDLTLAYNQTRQNAITTELLEITTAQAAMQLL